MGLDVVLPRLEEDGYSKLHRPVFVPYSTRDNWNRRYPQAPILIDDGGVKKRRGATRANIFCDGSLVNDAERNELHVEIYNYLKWLYERLAEIEEKSAAASAHGTGQGAASDVDGGFSEFDRSDDENGGDGPKKKNANKSGIGVGRRRR